MLAASLTAAALIAGVLTVGGSNAAGTHTITPSKTSFSYVAGPFTQVNVAGLVGGGCLVPDGCDLTDFTVSVPDSYYKKLRAQGKIGVVQIEQSWDSSADDFDLQLLKGEEPIASSGLGNSTFERITFTELASGTYTIQSTLFRVLDASVRVRVRLIAMQPGSVRLGGQPATFGGGTPVALERSSGEPNMEIAPNGDIYADIPLGAGTNSILYKSIDNGETFKPIAPLHPNNNPLSNNVIGGGDSGLAIDPKGRMCFSELNTLLSLGIGCSDDGGMTWTIADPLIVDPATPLVDRQWQAATPQGEQFISAQFGLVSAGPSQPGIRAYKEVATTGQFVKVADIDTGKAMKSYNLAVDPSDTDANGGTVVQAYLRPNTSLDLATRPNELMIWRTTDGGATTSRHSVARLPTIPGNNFCSVAIDRAGNIYVAWTEQGTWDVYYTVASKANPNKWTRPVRVNAEPTARTAIQPTIKVGDRGRVFIGYYAAEQYGDPNKLPNGVWHAYMSVSTNGACQLDARPCATPTFAQSRITDHPVQHRGICLGGTGCGGDPYHGDRSMLEYLDIEFSPRTGQAHVIVTDSSRAAGNTTITMYHQTGGPSAYAKSPAIRGKPRRFAATASSGVAVMDQAGDASWTTDSPIPSNDVAGADIRMVTVARPNRDTIRLGIVVGDLQEAELRKALALGGGKELLIGARFATETDVMWAGLAYNPIDGLMFVGGHLANGILVDAYEAEAIGIAGSIDGNKISIDIRLSALETTPQVPQGATARKFRSVAQSTTLYAVTAFSFASPTTFDDPFIAKHWLDVAPAFTLLGKK